jgi:hypothetical protein
MSDIHQGPLGCRATNLTTFSARVEARRVRSLQPPTAAFSDAERARSRSTRCCRPDRRDVVSRPVWIAQTRTPSSGASRGTHGCLVPARDPCGSSARAACRSGLRVPREIGEPDARVEHVRSTRCCDSGRRDIAARPVWTAQTGNSPTGAPWQQTGTLGFLAANRDLHGFLDKGDAMILRPCLVAWPVGSDWRTRRPD